MSSQNITKTIGVNNLQLYHDKGMNFMSLTCYSKDTPHCVEGDVFLDIDGIKELKEALDNFLSLREFEKKLAQNEKEGKR